MRVPGLHPSIPAPPAGFLPTVLTYLQGAPVSFGEAVTQAFRNAFVWRGRASRSAYWWFIVFLVIAGFLLSIAAQAVESLAGADGSKGAHLVFLVILGIPTLYADLVVLALSVRRLHDINRSAWWMLSAIVPFLGGVSLPGLGLLKGTPGPNRYQP